MFESKSLPKGKKSNHPAFIVKISHVFDETIGHVRSTPDRDAKRELG